MMESPPPEKNKNKSKPSPPLNFDDLPKYVEFIIIQLIYERAREHTRLLTRRKSKPVGSAPVIADWYLQVFVKERLALVPGTKECYRDWKIYSGDESYFTVDGQRYDQVYVILGLRTFYWMFFRKQPVLIKKYGEAPLACPYCGCCVFDQVPSIVDKVKDCIRLEDIPDKENGKP